MVPFWRRVLATRRYRLAPVAQLSAYPVCGLLILAEDILLDSTTSPHQSQIQPTAMMNHMRCLELFWDFSAKIEDLHTLYLDSVFGYEILYARLDQQQEQIANIIGSHEYATREFQDTCSIAYSDLGGREVSPVSMSPVMKQGDLRERVRENGSNLLLLGNQCIVSAYAYWEEYLRVEIGRALGVVTPEMVDADEIRGVLNQFVRNDVWGDARYLRNSIVHNNGVANEEVKKCRVFRWFSPGQKIELTYERMRKIFLDFGCFRNEIHALSLPKQVYLLPL